MTKKVRELKAEDTITSPTNPIPGVIHMEYTLMLTWSDLQQVLGSKWIASIPYCTKCKEPLIWVRNGSKVLFRCPKCGTKWVKSVGWDEEKKREQDEDNG